MSSMSPLERYHYEITIKPKGVQIFDIDGKITQEALEVCKEIGIKQEDLVSKTLDQFLQNNQNPEVAELQLEHFEKRRKYRIRQIRKFLIQKEKDDQYYQSHQVSPTTKYKASKETSPARTERMKEKRVKEIVDNMDYEQKLKLVRRLMKLEKIKHMQEEKDQLEKERMDQLESERQEKEKKFEEQTKINEKKRLEEIERFHRKAENQKQLFENIQRMNEQDIEERHRMQTTFFIEMTQKIEKDKQKEADVSKRNYQLYVQRSGVQKQRENDKMRFQDLWIQQSNSTFNSIVSDIQNKNNKKANYLLDRVRSSSTKNEYWKEIIQKNQQQNYEIDMLNQSTCLERYINVLTTQPKSRNFLSMQRKREELFSSAQKRREELDESDQMRRTDMLETLKSKIESADKTRYHTHFVQQQKYNTQKQFQRDDVAENLKFHQFSIVILPSLISIQGIKQIITKIQRNQREKEILRTKYKTIMAEKKKKLKEDILYVTNQGIKDISSQLRAEDILK